MKIKDRILNGLFFTGIANLTVGIPIVIFSMLTWFFNPLVGIIVLYVWIWVFVPNDTEEPNTDND